MAYSGGTNERYQLDGSSVGLLPPLDFRGLYRLIKDFPWSWLRDIKPLDFRGYTTRSITAHAGFMLLGGLDRGCHGGNSTSESWGFTDRHETAGIGWDLEGNERENGHREWDVGHRQVLME